MILDNNVEFYLQQGPIREEEKCVKILERSSWVKLQNLFNTIFILMM